MSRTAFVDVETTGLDPDRHEIWEVGLIGVDYDQRQVVERHRWFLPVDLGRADPRALAIGGFHERHPLGRRYTGWDVTSVPQGVHDHGLTELDHFASAFMAAIDDATDATPVLVGAVVSFDEERLRKLMQANGQCPEWHYHLVIVEALASGRLAATALLDPTPNLCQPPWDSTALSLAVGVDPGRFEKHTAYGDAEWARAIYERVYEIGPFEDPEEHGDHRAAEAAACAAFSSEDPF